MPIKLFFISILKFVQILILKSKVAIDLLFFKLNEKYIFIKKETKIRLTI